MDHIRIVAISFVSEQIAIELPHTNDEFMEVYDRYHTTPTTIHVHYYNNGEIEHFINITEKSTDFTNDSNDKYTKVVKV